MNQILRTLSDTCGVFAVNGPPGTGKTTMLRDVIAAIVVKRAIELACLASPGEAFTTACEQWQTVRHSHTITAPNPKLTGFEIVVASSNNGAVENVSIQIPGPKGIGGQWRGAAATVDYFSKTAGRGAWAMIAARLGNRANRAAFVQDFWLNRDSGMQNVLGRSAALPPDWQGAVASFRRALSRVKDLSAERSTVSRAITRLPAASQDHARAEANLESAMALRENLETGQQDANRRLREADDRWQMASSAIAAHRPGRPGLFALLSGRGRVTRWNWKAEHAELNGRFVVADRERDAASRAAQDVANRLAAARREEENVRRICDRLMRELEELRRQVCAARLRWGDHVPDGPEYAGQAPPQYAVGALWRVRRAVIVGDPLQLKPVVTLPWGGQRALARVRGR